MCYNSMLGDDVGVVGMGCGGGLGWWGGGVCCLLEVPQATSQNIVPVSAAHHSNLHAIVIGNL